MAVYSGRMAGSNELTFEEASYEFDTTVIHECRKAGSEEGIVGQPRAMRAMAMSLSLKQSGYNLFVSGDSGSGRLSAVRRVAEGEMADTSLLFDIVYVHNFHEPDHPRCLLFSPGEGRRFQEAMLSFSKQPQKEGIAQVKAQYPEAGRFLSQLEESLGRSSFDPKSCLWTTKATRAVPSSSRPILRTPTSSAPWTRTSRPTWPCMPARC